MSNYSKKLLQYVYDKWDKYSIRKNANAMIRNITKQRETGIFVKELTTLRLEPFRPLPEALVHWWEWYQHLVGLDTVEETRQKVILLQDKLSKCREARHALRQEAFIINNKAKALNMELLKIKRDNPKYVTLTIMENEALQDLNKNNEQFNLLDKEEKDHFMQLTTAFNQYQDAQSLNAQKYKYLSIFVTIFAALLSVISSSVYHNQRLKEIQVGILDMQEKSESNIIKYLEEYMGLSKKNSKDVGWLEYTKNATYTVGKYLVLKGILW